MPTNADTAFASIRTLGQQLRAGEVTSVELTEYFLERLERLGPKLNAVVTLTRELALEQAKKADQQLKNGADLGPLHGIPYGAKDLLATQGVPTSWGAFPLKDQQFDEDAAVIQRLRDAGAVLCGKLAMVEIAGGLGYDQADASFTGPGLNPWNVKRWSGGSSSGSGSAVGGGLVPFAIGSETWGSIMTPAGFCGLSGLRPTYGRVSRRGAMALSWTMDKLGPLCRTADDCGLVLAAIAGHDPRDPTSLVDVFHWPLDAAEKPEPPFRLAVLEGTLDAVQPEIAANFSKSLEVLEPHTQVFEIGLPPMPFNEVAATIIECEKAAAFEDLLKSGDVWKMTAPEDRIGLHAAMFIPAKDYINALRVRVHIGQLLDEILADFDAIVIPSQENVAPPIDRDFNEYASDMRLPPIGGAANAAGVPAISVPNGFGEDGLPTGLKFVARARNEAKLLALADFYQQHTDWHTKHPEW